MAKAKRTSMDNKARRSGFVRALVVVFIVSMVASGIFALVRGGTFSLREIEVSGNRQISTAEIISLTRVSKGDNLLTMKLERVYDNLQSSPWLRKVTLRKELPSKLVVIVEEANPVAILKRRKGMFIVDGNGIELQTLAGRPESFMAVIEYEGRKDTEAFMLALELAATVRETLVMNEAHDVVIYGIEGGPTEIGLSIDGVRLKLGEGGYAEKLVKYFELSEAITSRNINVDYIDLRFNGRVVVKPMQERKG